MDTEQLKADLERITFGRAMEPGETMSQVLTRLDACVRSAHVPDGLQHYLSKRSYVKALAWLEDPAVPHQP